MNYLIETDSKVLLDEELKKIVKNSMNKVIYQFSDVKIKDILEEASYVSMFSDTKYLIVKNADFFGKGKLTDEESKLLQSYLNHPYEMTVLIFTTYEPIDKRKKIVKEFNGKVISLKSFSGFDLVNATKKLVLSKGYHISDDGIRYLISACLNNWDLINSEVNKLGLIFKKDDKITNDVLRDIVSQNISDKKRLCYGF